MIGSLASLDCEICPGWWRTAHRLTDDAASQDETFPDRSERRRRSGEPGVAQVAHDVGVGAGEQSLDQDPAPRCDRSSPCHMSVPISGPDPALACSARREGPVSVSSRHRSRWKPAKARSPEMRRR
jgi:hypothetical protein